MVSLTRQALFFLLKPPFFTLVRIVDFDQGQFNFDAQGPEEGYRKWREELDEKRRAFEIRWGVILSKRVTVTLRDLAKPISGVLRIVENPNSRNCPPRLEIKGLEFTPAEIESIVQADPDDAAAAV